MVRALLSPRARMWLLAAAVVALNNAPRLLTPPKHTPDEMFTGFYAVDELFYFACARKAADDGFLGLFYANPFAFQPDAKRIYSQLYFVHNGWLWRLTGLSFPAIALLVQLVYGVLFLGLVAECLYFRFRGRWFFWPAVLLLFVGGGGAWMMATVYSVSDWLGLFSREVSLRDLNAAQWATVWYDHYEYSQGIGLTWGLNLFRRLAGGNRVFHHALFYAGWLALLRGRWTVAFVFSFLLWWSHPFTAVDFGVPLLAVAVAMAFVERGVAARIRWGRAGVAAVFLAAGLFYYMVYLGNDSLHAITQEQMREAYFAIKEWQLLPLLGVLFFVPFLLHWFPPRWRERPTIATLCLFVCVLVLTFHHRFMRACQPLHFDQAYLFFSLVFLACEMLDRRAPEARAGRDSARGGRVTARWRWAILAAAYLSLFPDNVVFFFGKMIPAVKRGGICLSAPEMDLVNYLATIPGRRRILYLDDDLACNVAAYAAVVTPHSFLIGHRFNTPDVEGRAARMKQFIQTGDLGIWRENDPQMLVVPAARAAVFEAVIRPKGSYRLVHDTGAFAVYEIRQACAKGSLFVPYVRLCGLTEVLRLFRVKSLATNVRTQRL